MLTDLKVRQAKARESDYKLPDGGGLHLFVTKKGYKSWRLKYRFAGKEKLLVFAPIPTSPLLKHGSGATRRSESSVSTATRL